MGTSIPIDKLGPRDVLLVGKLWFTILEPHGLQVFIDCWCPFCRVHHTHGWFADMSLSVEDLERVVSVEAVHRKDKDCSAPFTKFHLGLDSHLREVHAKVIVEYQQALAYRKWSHPRDFEPDPLESRQAELFAN